MSTKKVILCFSALIISANSFSFEKAVEKNDQQSSLLSSVLLENSALQDNVQAEFVNLITLQSGIKNLYNSDEANKVNYKSINPDVLLTARVVPDEMRSINNIKSRFGPVIISASQYAKKSFDAFDITYTNVPKADCLELLTAIHEQFDKIEVGDVVVKNNNAKIIFNNVYSACSLKNTNKITFTSI